jgi:hypothetical protein
MLGNNIESVFRRRLHLLTTKASTVLNYTIVFPTFMIVREGLPRDSEVVRGATREYNSEVVVGA